MIQGIPSAQIVSEAARRNKDYEVDFANTESNELKAFLRHSDKQYKVRLVLISGILAYPALDMVWVFTDEEYELASRVFHRICDEVDDVKTHYDQSMTPISTLGAQIREAVKPISSSHREKTFPKQPSLTKSKLSSWRVITFLRYLPNFAIIQLAKNTSSLYNSLM